MYYDTNIKKTMKGYLMLLDYPSLIFWLSIFELRSRLECSTMAAQACIGKLRAIPFWLKIGT
jgi:hypothetical protein